MGRLRRLYHGLCVNQNFKWHSQLFRKYHAIDKIHREKVQRENSPEAVTKNFLNFLNEEILLQWPKTPAFEIPQMLVFFFDAPDIRLKMIST